MPVKHSGKPDGGAPQGAGSSKNVDVGENSAGMTEKIDPTSTLSPSEQKVLSCLQQLHNQHLEYELKYRKEWNELKLKYYKLLDPLYKDRKRYLHVGVCEENAEDSPLGGTGSSTKATSIPDFWLTAFRNNSSVNQTIEQHDIPLLKYLTDVTFCWLDELAQMSFRIDMHFAENPFFKNEVLNKTYYLESEQEFVDSILTRTEGTQIEWYEGKNVTKKNAIRRQRNKRTGQMRVIVDEVPRESFFNLFENRDIPDDSKLDQMSATEVAELENTLELEYELGCVIRDKIIPHSYGWYLGTEIDDDDLSMSDSFEDDEASDDDQDQGSGDSDDEDEPNDNDEDAQTLSHFKKNDSSK